MYFIFDKPKGTLKIPFGRSNQQIELDGLRFHKGDVFFGLGLYVLGSHPSVHDTQEIVVSKPSGRILAGMGQFGKSC